MVKKFQHTDTIGQLCKWVDLAPGNYYYKPSGGKKGFKPTVTTGKKDGSCVSNDAVIEEIKSILSGEFVCYGYQKVTVQLKNLDYIINHKKVYRLMDENNLLLGKVIKTNGRRQWVKHRKIKACRPMEYLCLDIKYLWVSGEQRWYYLLTILDVYSRKVLQWVLQKSVRKIDVINLFRLIDLQYGIKGVNIRNDNGSQFIANDVKQFLRMAEANQEFTHIATPEENAYIEAYHSIVQKEIVERFEFASYYEARMTMQAYVDFYNNRRLHSGVEYKTPQQAWTEYEKINFVKSDEAEAGNAGEQPARNNLISGEVLEGVYNAPSSPENIFAAMPQKTQSLTTKHFQTNLNCLEKSL
jgi:transposase InsO family protein